MVTITLTRVTVTTGPDPRYLLVMRTLRPHMSRLLTGLVV
jgi:hypothetical protein